MQIQENKIVDYYLSLNNLNNLPINKDTAVRVSNQIRKDFNVEENSFTKFKLLERPILREDVGFLLTYREGLCGEGARVIVDLLNRLGFDATRITLYNKVLESSHTLVSIVINEKELLVDSINSTAEVNELLRKYDVSPSDFNLMHYDNNFGAISSKFIPIKDHQIKPEFKNFLNHYWLYSYEAEPFSKILTKIGLDIRVFNFKRPTHIISILAERPNTVMFFITLFFAIFYIYILYQFKIIRYIIKSEFPAINKYITNPR
jgi:hypothetical protein